MSDAKKLPSGRWRNRLYVGKDKNGKRIYESFTADTKKEANLMAMERARELELGLIPERTPIELTLGEAIDKYIDERSNVLAPKTVREYRILRRNHFLSLMSTKLKHLTPSLIQQTINDEAKKCAPKTVQNVWSLINASITYSVPKKRFSPTLPALVKTELHIPTNDELLLLLNYVHGKGMEIPILLGAVCGLRRGEISALNLCRDVDYENCRITIREAATHDENNVWSTKSPKEYHSSRTIDAPPWIIEQLLAFRESGKTILRPPSITKGFYRLKKKFNIPVRFHDLRHYYASVMISIGVPDIYAMKRMGHSTPYTLKKVYQHIIDDADQEMTVRINDHFQNVHHEMHHDNADAGENGDI